MLGMSKRKTKDETVWSINAICSYCKKGHKVELSPGTEATTTLIPCYPCWDRYEENSIDIPTDILFSNSKIEAEKQLKKLWLEELDIPAEDFRYFKQFIRDNFK